MSEVSKRRLRLGMVGGGEGAFIGEVHRFAARLDDHYELLAGALSSQSEKAKRSAESLGIIRYYTDFEVMAEEESKREDGIEVVSIVTPNHLHASIAAAFLAKGIHVICDKPLTATLVQAEELLEKAKHYQAQFLLTHNYSAYPMVREARAMVKEGQLGYIRSIQVEYVQDWLTSALEKEGNKQASWRSDPSQAGIAGCVGDIGSHAYQLACFVADTQAQEVLADLSSWGEGRQLDDEANILIRFNNGAKGHLWASQVALGNENGLRLRIYGDKAGLEWSQESPNELTFSPIGLPRQSLRRGNAYLSQAASSASRIPSGHPEGYLEAFANLYREFALQLMENTKSDVLPNLLDGLHGMKFITATVVSSKQGSEWVSVS
ncbi:Glucose--fructose oxidoreductase precursor [Marinomonas spartinae]|uniref:Gfo/Idh/MocA family protein n=1 Tax=Marinomonas spartinae TaxID=1792290 RepID=UPI000808E9AC|nr:Gfo/Idh/MocA family oxidoreductase [Marinomonas spartinae]SBS29500.1 Glucose--fructose oxidoreductase precursor [Marinomonas spartinae]